MSFEEKFYILNCHSYIKKIPNTYLCAEFSKNLENLDGTLKPHISDLKKVVTTDRFPSIKCTIPTLFIEIEYKTSDGHYLINHEVFLYEEDYPTLKDLEAYKEKVSYGFASQVTQEIKDIVEAFHNGYGCMCLSSGDY
mgnify:FL=1|jgi:hypothetical protein